MDDINALIKERDKLLKALRIKQKMLHEIKEEIIKIKKELEEIENKLLHNG